MEAYGKTSGFAYGPSTAIGTAAVIIEVKAAATPSDSPPSTPIPDDCIIETLEVELDTMALSPTTIHAYVARDASGDVPLTPGGVAGATQTIQPGATTATKGGVIFAFDKLYRRDSAVSGSAKGSLYVVIKTNVGTANAQLRLCWLSR